MTADPTRRQLLAAGAGLLAAGTPPVAAAAEPPAKRQFQLGIVTYNVAKDWDLPTILKVCKATGVAAVECRTTHKHGVEPTLSADARREVKKQFADTGVFFHGCGSACEFHSPDPAEVARQVELCKQFVQLTADIGGRGVKVRPNGLPKDVPVEKTLEQIGKALAECGKAAADAGVEIQVEVHGPGTQDPAHMRTIMEACGHKSVGVTWNSNATDVKDGSVAASFDLLKSYIRNVHINDLYKDASKGYPYRELFRLLRETGYDRYTLCEVGRSPADPTLGEDFLRYYKALWEELSRA